MCEAVHGFLKKQHEFRAWMRLVRIAFAARTGSEEHYRFDGLLRGNVLSGVLREGGLALVGAEVIVLPGVAELRCGGIDRNINARQVRVLLADQTLGVRLAIMRGGAGTASRRAPA